MRDILYETDYTSVLLPYKISHWRSEPSIQAIIKMNPGTTTPAQTADHNLTRRPRGESKHRVHRPQLAFIRRQQSWPLRSAACYPEALQPRWPFQQRCCLWWQQRACRPPLRSHDRKSWCACTPGGHVPCYIRMLHVLRWLHVRQSCWLHTARCMADGACHTSIAYIGFVGAMHASLALQDMAQA